MNKRYRSVIKKVVLIPLVIMLFLSAAVFATAVVNYHETREREIENRLDVIRSGYAQLEGVMKQCEYTFSSYFVKEPSYRILKNTTSGQQNTDYFEAVVDSLRYLEPVRDANDVVSGIFLYYPNIPSLNFRGTNVKDIHDRLAQMLESGTGIYNQWFLLRDGLSEYLVYIMRLEDVCCGCWMQVSYVLSSFGLEDAPDGSNGQVYFADHQGENTLPEEGVHELLKGREDQSILRDGNTSYRNYQVRGSGRAVYPGLLIKDRGLFSEMPLHHRIVFLLAFLGFASTIGVVLWLNSRISRPILLLKDAMDRYGSGEIEYRLEERDVKVNDEFDLLGKSLNSMMDKVNDLEFSLYQTKLKEQETQLRYISQQIRPHFILNALNVIYTYREDEFPLVKKMVIYLVNYFRYIVNLKVDFVELRHELRHVENYLNIQKERTEGKIDFFVEWEHAVSDVLIPPLILQTFVENSIKYAVNDSKLYIIVHAGEEQGKLIVSISDTGQGFSPEKLEAIRNFLRTREDDGTLGVGIVNAVERMDILYQGEAELHVGNSPTGGAVTEICLPLRRHEDP